MAKRDYYEVLGAQQDASADEIKKAFRSVLPLTKTPVSAKLKTQHPVLASASAGLFVGKKL